MDEPKVIVDIPEAPRVPEIELPSYDLVDAGLTQPLVIRPPQRQRQESQPPYVHAGPYPSIAPSTVDLAPDSWRPPPRKNGLPIVLGVMGLCGTLVALAGVVGVHRWHAQQKEDAEYAQKIADENRRASAGTNPVMVPAPVDTTPDLTVTPDPVPTIDLSAPKPVVKAEPKPIPTTQAKPVVKAAPTTKATGAGTVRTYNTAAGKAIFVDGKQAGVAPAPLSVSCGVHQIRVGEGKARSVNVPCGGNVTVGTPDGD